MRIQFDSGFPAINLATKPLVTTHMHKQSLKFTNKFKGWKDDDQANIMWSNESYLLLAFYRNKAIGTGIVFVS